MTTEIDVTKIIPIKTVANDMIKAVTDSLGDDVPDAAKFGTQVLEDYIKNVGQAQLDAATRAISRQEANELSESAGINLGIGGLVVQGIEKIAAQNAINAAIDVLNAALNTAIDTALGLIKIPPVVLP